MKNLITAALIAVTATSAQADTASSFAECVSTRVAAENGLTLEEARASLPAITRELEINLAIMANAYLEMPTSVNSQKLAILMTEVPQFAACRHILER